MRNVPLHVAWASWTTGFLLVDGQVASLGVRMTGADGGHLPITARQDDLDRKPTVFARGAGGPGPLYAAGQSETTPFGESTHDSTLHAVSRVPTIRPDRRANTGSLTRASRLASLPGVALVQEALHETRTF